MSKDIYFTCYRYEYTGGETTLFLFYENGIWDEDKQTIAEAIETYPPTEYNWLHFNDTLPGEIE